MNKTICIYHANCADGFAAAWVVKEYGRKTNTPIEFIPGVYQEPPPNVSGAFVIMVDFSYKREIIKQMAKEASGILILDHHKTAMEDLEDLDLPNVTAVFDMDKSGAMITWNYFNSIENPRPTLLQHIQDRDLWKFELLFTREIQAAVFSYPYEFEVWDKLMQADIAELISEGRAIERKHFKDINELLPVVTRLMKIGGHIVEIANLPYIFSSDAGHILAERETNAFGACYWDTPEGRVFSLRSSNEKEDVSQIATQYGGGGHRNAAGFKVSFEEARLMEIGK